MFAQNLAVEPRKTSGAVDLLLVGGVPRPVGGVTQHVWRLASQFADRGVEILDLYPDVDKYQVPGVRLRVAPRNKILQALWVARELRRTAAKTVHFHFSTVRRIALLNPVIRWCNGGRRFMLTLHHGELIHGWKELSPRQRLATIHTLNSFHRIVSLSDHQTEFYETIARIPSGKIVPGTSYVPLSSQLMAQLKNSEQALAFLPVERKEARILVASGYPERIYHHEMCIDLLDALKPSIPAHLMLCLYGKAESPGYLEKLLKRCARPDVTVCHDLSFPEFMNILGRAALYLRPTAVDSFGLAVADAINADVPAVASTVCQRYPGAYLIDPHQPEMFSNVCRKVLTGDTTDLVQATEPLPITADDFYD